MKPRGETANPPRPLPPEGALLLVDKPRGPTSHDVVNRLRRLFGLRRVGHGGTLDPMATGLLVAALGPATRLLQFLTGLDKEYEGEITLGAVSSTYDAEGEIAPCGEAGAWPAPGRVEEAMRRFEGLIEQRPPAYSAIKSKGRPLYEQARRGLAVSVAPRPARVDFFQLTDCAAPTIRFRCRVSSGTYVRSLAHDLGQALGCGAYLSALRRTAVGPHRVEEASSLEWLESDPPRAWERLLSPSQALGYLARVEVAGAAAARLENGVAFGSGEIVRASRTDRPGEPVAAVDSGGRLLAVCRREAEGEPYRPICVFPSRR